MQILRPNTCKNCQFKHMADGKLFCRLHPPTATPIIVVTPTGPQHVGTLTMNPMVEPDNWCGQHKRRVIGANDAIELSAVAN